VKFHWFLLRVLRLFDRRDEEGEGYTLMPTMGCAYASSYYWTAIELLEARNLISWDSEMIALRSASWQTTMPRLVLLCYASNYVAYPEKLLVYATRAYLYMGKNSKGDACRRLRRLKISD